MKQYKMADRVLRKFPGNDISERFPPFCFLGNRVLLGHTVNPYLVILDAEIKFRRYLAADGPELPPDYKSLMEKNHRVDMAAFHFELNFNDAELGFQIHVDESGASTARQQKPAVGGGGETRRADAVHWRHAFWPRYVPVVIISSLTDWEYDYPLVDFEMIWIFSVRYRNRTGVSSTGNFDSTPHYSSQ